MLTIYRAWDRKRKELFPVHELQFSKHDGEPVFIKGYTHDEKDIWDVYGGGNMMYANEARYILMKFTELHDINGERIYEKDVVKVRGHIMVVHFGKHAYDTRDFLLAGGLYREIHGFYLESPCGSWQVHIAVELNYIRKIGNIYENPELAEGVV